MQIVIYVNVFNFVCFLDDWLIKSEFAICVHVEPMNFRKIHNVGKKTRDMRLFFKKNHLDFKPQQMLKFANISFLCFGEDIIQLNNAGKMRKNLLEYITINWCKISKNHRFIERYRILLKFLETHVRFCVFSCEILEKYIQTKEPFQCEVGYNILGEGQQFVDEKNRSTYNNKELSILTIKQLTNRMSSIPFLRRFMYHGD